MSDVVVAEEKICNACGVLKPLTEYRRKSRNKDGRFPKCKQCMKMRESSEEHKQRNRDRANEWYKANPLVVIQRSAEWAKANRERSNTSKYKSYHSAGMVESRANNRDKFRAYKANRRTRLSNAGGSHTKEDIRAIAKAQHMECVYCRRDITNKYHVDHIMPVYLGGGSDKSNLQILCPTCNQKKGRKHPDDFLRERSMMMEGG